MDSSVARRPIENLDQYRQELTQRLDPTASSLQAAFEVVRSNPRRVVFAEGEEEQVIRAAMAFRAAGYGTPVLIGREHRIKETMNTIGLDDSIDLEIHNARLSSDNVRYAQFLYERLQRRGYLFRDCQRMVNQDRNVFGSCMVMHGDADAMVTGATRSFSVALEDICRVIAPSDGERVIGLQMVVAKGRTVFIADTNVHEVPDAEALADIAVQSAAKARQLGQEPRVALLAYSNFGNPMRPQADRIREAVRILDRRNVDFEYDGEMSADRALNYALLKRLYPFCRLSGPANVLVMPALHSANISAKLLQELGGGSVIGPMLLGMSKSVQIVPMGSTVSDIVHAAALAAHDSIPS